MATAPSRARHLHTRTRGPCRPSGAHYLGTLRRALRSWKLPALAERTSIICKATNRKGSRSHHSGYRYCGRLRNFSVAAARRCWLAFFRFWRVQQNRRMDQRSAWLLAGARLTLQLCASLSRKFRVQPWSKVRDSHSHESPIACAVRRSFFSSRRPFRPKRS